MNFRKIDEMLHDSKLSDLPKLMDPVDPIADAIGANFWQKIVIWIVVQVVSTYFYGPFIGMVLKRLGFENLGLIVGMFLFPVNKLFLARKLGRHPNNHIRWHHILVAFEYW